MSYRKKKKEYKNFLKTIGENKRLIESQIGFLDKFLLAI